MNLENRRRVMMQGGDKPYEGWTYGYQRDHDSPGYLKENAIMAASPWMYREQGHLVKILFSTTLNFQWQYLVYMSSDGVTINTNDNQGAYSCEIELGYGRWPYFCFTAHLADLDDCYVLDETTGIYLWKGKNV